MRDYFVVMYRKDTGKIVGTVAGLGRNKNTWDSHHSRRTATKYARQLNAENPLYTYKVETL